MLKISLSFRPLFIITLLFTLSAARPFDWQYSRLTIPFSVFYNPSLLGNNPGYTFGFDVRHADSASYDIRGALVVPIGEMIDFYKLSQFDDNNKYFRYANHTHRSSKTAFSIGGIYAGNDDYQLTAGFAAPLSFVQTGMAMDFMYIGEAYKIALTIGAGADFKHLFGENILHFTVHNVITGDDGGINHPSFSIGTSGLASQDSRRYNLPYDAFLRFHVKDGNMNVMEGMARLNIDLMTPRILSRQTIGQAIKGSIGYGFFIRDEDNMDHRVFASLGVSFISRFSATTVMGGYERDNNNKYAAAIYNSFKTSAATLFADIKLEKVDNGQILIGLKTADSNVKSWVLRIDCPRGTSIKTFSGGNVIPSTIVWDGLKSDGSEIEDETVYIKLVLVGINNKVVSSNTEVIEMEYVK